MSGWNKQWLSIILKFLFLGERLKKMIVKVRPTDISFFSKIFLYALFNQFNSPLNYLKYWTKQTGSIKQIPVICLWYHLKYTYSIVKDVCLDKRQIPLCVLLLAECILREKQTNGKNDYTSIITQYRYAAWLDRQM